MGQRIVTNMASLPLEGRSVLRLSPRVDLMITFSTLLLFGPFPFRPKLSVVLCVFEVERTLSKVRKSNGGVRSSGSSGYSRQH